MSHLLLFFVFPVLPHLAGNMPQTGHHFRLPYLCEITKALTSWRFQIFHKNLTQNTQNSTMSLSLNYTVTSQYEEVGIVEKISSEAKRAMKKLVL